MDYLLNTLNAIWNGGSTNAKATRTTISTGHRNDVAGIACGGMYERRAGTRSGPCACTNFSPGPRARTNNAASPRSNSGACASPDLCASAGPADDG